jgi:hypothetical protein
LRRRKRERGRERDVNCACEKERVSEKSVCVHKGRKETSLIYANTLSGFGGIIFVQTNHLIYFFYLTLPKIIKLRDI